MSTTDVYAVPRDVWDAIVPQASATDAREQRATGWVVVAFVALAILTGFAAHAGIFGPRLTSSSISDSSANSTTRTGQLTIDVRNAGRLGTHITSVHLLTAAGPVLHVTGVRSTPDRIDGGGMGSLVVSYQITNCDAVRSVDGEAGPGTGGLRAEDAIVVEARTWWGGTRAMALEPLGSAVGDLIAPACLPADASTG